MTPQVIVTQEKVRKIGSHIWHILRVVETLPGFRLILKIVGANPSGGFVNLIYSLSNQSTKPFLGAVSAGVSTTPVMEGSTLVVIAVYAVVIWLVIEYFRRIKPMNRK